MKTMKKERIHKYSKILAIVLLTFIIAMTGIKSNAAIVNIFDIIDGGISTKIAIVDDSNTGYYLIYTESYDTEFEFAFSQFDGVPPTPLEYQPAEQDEYGNWIVPVPYLDEGTALFLYTQTLGAVPMLSNEKINYTYDPADLIGLSAGETKNVVLSQEDADYVLNTKKRIPIITKENEEVSGYNQIIVITIGNNAVAPTVTTNIKDENLKYKLVKFAADDKKTLSYWNEAYWDLKLKADAVSAVDESTNPIEAIISMRVFLDAYDDLFPVALSAVVDNVIDEPIDTVNGDYYAVWLMGEDIRGTEVRDLHIMLCLREDERTADEIRRLPQTGASIVLEVLFVVNVLALIIVYAKKRKTQKKEV